MRKRIIAKNNIRFKELQIEAAKKELVLLKGLIASLEVCGEEPDFACWTKHAPARAEDLKREISRMEEQREEALREYREIANR